MLNEQQKVLIINNVAKDNNFNIEQIKVVLTLLEEGNTIPFIARYRQEVTKGLNEEQIRLIQKEYEYQLKLENRKEEIINILKEREMLTNELESLIHSQIQMSALENIYYPYREKKKTKATEAIAKGLEPLANWILTLPDEDINKKADEFINPEKDILNIEQALQGAEHIIAEKTMEATKTRDYTLKYFNNYGQVNSKAKKDFAKLDERKVYEIYYDFNQRVKWIKPYQILAINRAEKEKVINVKILVEDESLFEQYYKWFANKENEASNIVKKSIIDGYKRLLQPSIEREVRSELTSRAENYSIKEIFVHGLEKTLLQRPVKNKIILGLDPAYRTGCKLTIIDQTGKMLAMEKIYPHQPMNKWKESLTKLEELYKNYNFNLVAIGNGTASRESELLISEFIASKNIEYLIVSESGASVYSASKLAKEEFPDLSVEERSAVSIARRLQDPLAELVKIDPKSIGVGQYQHDLNQKNLGEELGYTVGKIVNNIGVDINTASAELLSYISGLTKTTSKNIVKYRDENGKINSRTEIKKIKGIGPKAYEQAVGFLRIIEGSDELDVTNIHPESYKVVKNILKEYSLKISDFGKEEFILKIKSIKIDELITKYQLSEFDAKLFINSLSQTTIDPRENLDGPVFRKGVTNLEDLKQGEILSGVVRNILEFGAFVDIGLKNDALLHKSKMGQNFVKDPRDKVEIGEIIEVIIDDIDLEKNRISLRTKE